MNAFEVAIHSLFRDSNLITQATYHPLHGKEKRVAVITHKPDEYHAIGETMIATPTIAIDVAVSNCANVQPGERFVIDGKTFVVQGEPKADSERITFRVNLCAS